MLKKRQEKSALAASNKEASPVESANADPNSGEASAKPSKKRKGNFRPEKSNKFLKQGGEERTSAKETDEGAKKNFDKKQQPKKKPHFAKRQVKNSTPANRNGKSNERSTGAQKKFNSKRS